jgi:hypothetical protein
MAHAEEIAPNDDAPRLPNDATLESVFDLLGKPEDYLAAAYAKLHAGYKVDPNAKIRIGVQGNGTAPNYRIEINGEQILHSWNGQSHKPLLQGENYQDQNWSQKTIGYESLQKLLLQARD